jgi:WD40 repeat protein
MLVAFHEGPPFKFKQSHNLHPNFVNCVRYSPDGEWAVSAGSDSKICLYDGKTGDLVKDFAKPDGISGSLWAVEWSPDSTHFATAGGDKTVRIWSREAGAEVSATKVGKQVLEDQQVGLSWVSPKTIVSVSLDGRLLVWKVEDTFAATLSSTVDGTQGALTCLACDAKSGTLLQGGSDGFVALTPATGPILKSKIGKGVQHIIGHSKGYKGDAEACVIALDNIVRRVSIASGEVVGSPVEVKEFAVGADWLDAEETKLLIVSSKNSMHCVSSSALDWSKAGAVERQPTAMATLPGKMVAIAMDKPDGNVGGVASQKYDIQLFNLAGTASDSDVSIGKLLEGHMGEVTTMRFSPCGKFLISADAANKIWVWDIAEGAKVSSDFSRHTARVTTLNWLDSKRFISGSLDQKVTVHDVESKSMTAAKVADLEQAHRGGVTAVVACGEDSFASVGQDGFLLIHKLK